MSEAKHILGMEPDSVCRQMIRNYFHGRKSSQPITGDDCAALMMRFSEWLVSTNEILQKLVLDKINTTLPAPIVVESSASPQEKEK